MNVWKLRRSSQFRTLNDAQRAGGSVNALRCLTARHVRVVFRMTLRDVDSFKAPSGLKMVPRMSPSHPDKICNYSLLSTPSTVSPTWPEEFDVAPLPVKSDKITILKRPASAPTKSYSQALKETHWKSLDQRKAEYNQARIRILGSAEPQFGRRCRRRLRK